MLVILLRKEGRSRMMEQVGLALGVVTSIGILSFILKSRDNPLYNFASYTYLGVSIGYVVVSAIDIIVKRVKIISSDPSILVPMILGILFFTRIQREFAWISSYAMVLLVGTGVAIFAYGHAQSMIIGQISAAVIIPSNIDIGWIILTIATIVTIFYFTFTIEFRGTTNLIPRFGRYFLMVLFGALNGSTIPERLAYAISTVIYVLQALGLKV